MRVKLKVACSRDDERDVAGGGHGVSGSGLGMHHSVNESCAGHVPWIDDPFKSDPGVEQPKLVPLGAEVPKSLRDATNAIARAQRDVAMLHQRHTVSAVALLTWHFGAAAFDYVPMRSGQRRAATTIAKEQGTAA